jgi:hypothetical protein
MSLFKRKKLSVEEVFVKRFLNKKHIWWSDDVGKSIVGIPPRIGPLLVEFLKYCKKHGKIE